MKIMRGIMDETKNIKKFYHKKSKSIGIWINCINNLQVYNDEQFA